MRLKFSEVIILLVQFFQQSFTLPVTIIIIILGRGSGSSIQHATVLLMLIYSYFSASEEEVKVAQLCPTLCDSMDYTVQGILQARLLEWVTFPFSRGSSQPRDGTQVSCIARELFTSWATKKALVSVISQLNCQGKIQSGKFSWEYFSESVHTC